MRSALAIIFLAGCTTSNPGSGASISYYMPLTKAEAMLTVKYIGCTPQIGAAPKLEFKQDIALNLSAGADTAQSFHIDGADLRHWRQTRDVSIGVSKLGVIESVNAAGADKSAEILSNALSSLSPLASLTGVGIRETEAYGQIDLCAMLIPPTLRAGRARADALKQAIDDIGIEIADLSANGQWTNQNGDSITDLKETATALAEEFVRLESQVLTVQTKKNITFGVTAPSGVTVFSFSPKAFEKWSPQNSYQTELIDMLRARNLEFTRDDVNPREVVGPVKPECKTPISVPRPDIFTLKFSPIDPILRIIPLDEDNTVDLAIGVDPGSSLSRKVPMQQWSRPGAVCLDLNFGETRTVALKFDGFGRTTSFGWKSNARGEAITSVFSGAVSQLNTLSDEFAGQTETERQAAEITRLETEQKYNRLKECEAIIDAGGYDCDPDD